MTKHLCDPIPDSPKLKVTLTQGVRQNLLILSRVEGSNGFWEGFPIAESCTGFA